MDKSATALAPVLARFGIDARPSDFIPLEGGRSNRIWLLRGALSDGDAVLKLFPTHSDNPLFPNDGNAELNTLSHLVDTGLAPKPIGGCGTDLGFCLLYKHVPGAVASFHPNDVGHYLARLHKVQAPAGLRHVPTGADGLRQTAREVAARVAQNTLPPMPRIADVPPAKTTCLLHGDLVPSNLVSESAGLVAIDWQCPAVGDPCEDIAIFLSPAMQVLYGGSPLSNEDERAFFSAYGNAAVESRYRSLKPLYHWRMAAYCAWKAERGETDYARAMGLELVALQRSANP
ncbi:aminoglycoside phosphotransferase family protein [Shimia biformata]|uniref:aminoglycoside phosphotransferase family protein n=1 Tax=Shimia biformata TaxID=1294299 RepID=UPI00194E1FEC|nr:aminoglycoside phosphotransferase family protein [Shimia biformata]